MSEHLDQLRANVAATAPAPPEMASYLEKVRRHAYTVTDADVQRLKDTGFGEDEIFEHTVSAAVVAGLERLDAGLRALR